MWRVRGSTARPETPSSVDVVEVNVDPAAAEEVVDKKDAKDVSGLR